MAIKRPQARPARLRFALTLLGVFVVLVAVNSNKTALQSFPSFFTSSGSAQQLSQGAAAGRKGHLPEEEPSRRQPSQAAAAAPGDLPAPSFTPAQLKQRCAGTVGTWCQEFLQQRPIPARAPPHGNRTCLWDCNRVGVCNYLSGLCRCPAGWQGDHCDVRLNRPCSWRDREHGFEPFDQPVNFSMESPMNGRCAFQCDRDTGQCFCDSDTEFGRIPADLTQPPGTPPVRRGRPAGFYCQPNKHPVTGEELVRFGGTDPADLIGPQGWCRAKVPVMKGPQRCECVLDGYCGPYCDEVCETYCPNQCNGHGECLTGFCKCHVGWWGQDCAYRTQGTPWTPGMEQKERPWLRNLVHTPAARDPAPGDTRKRPLIYIYELPPIFNNMLLQYRDDRSKCVHRLFTGGNRSELSDSNVYCSETGLHEMLLQSEQRTLDPEEADFFYLPVYTSCYLNPIFAYLDTPYFHGHSSIRRVHVAVNMLIEMHAWIQSHFPYWDRRGGRDHVILQSHDEGSCWLPAVLRPAIVLTHWGRTDERHVSMSGFGLDNYTEPNSHPLYMPEGIKGKLGQYPCFDSEKDLVIPAVSSFQKYASSPLAGAPTLERTILAFFKGRTQQFNPAYSRGIRQKLENLTRDDDWWGKHKIHIGAGFPEGLGLGYGEAHASSTFCFALPGDGWSARLEDSVLHGCIPVIIQDNITMAFETVLDFNSFSLRIPEKDLARVPEILKAVPPERVAQLQSGLAAVWRRFAYTNYKPYKEKLLHYRRHHAGVQGTAHKGPEVLRPPPDYDPTQSDALETIYAWLHSRIPHTRQRQGSAQAGEPASASVVES